MRQPVLIEHPQQHSVGRWLPSSTYIIIGKNINGASQIPTAQKGVVILPFLMGETVCF